MAGIYGLGAKLIADSTAAVTTIVELTNIGDINMTAEDVDVSSHASRIKQYLKGLVELGEVPFEGNYRSSQGSAILAHMLSGGSTQTQTITIPGKLKMTFPGYLKGFGFGIPHDGKVSLSGALKIAGTPTLSTST